MRVLFVLLALLILDSVSAQTSGPVEAPIAIDLGTGYSVSVTPPPGWDTPDGDPWTTIYDGNCWASPNFEAKLCVKSVHAGDNKEAAEIMEGEVEGITYFGDGCREYIDSAEDFAGGRAVFRQCIIPGVLGDERHSWMAAVVDGALRGFWMQVTEYESSEEIEAAIQAIYPTITFAGPGIIDPDAGRVSFDLTGGYEASFVPPSGWVQNTTTEGECYLSPDYVANLCVRVVDMGWQNAREYLLPDINPSNCHDKLENQGATSFGAFAMAACIVNTNNGPRRQSWLMLQVTGAPMGLRIFTDESEEKPANWEAMQVSSASFTGGMR